MALVVVASAKGAPGVTTLTVALGALTPGAIVADLDPDGGDLALRYGREDGSPLDPEIGLLSLAASLRRDHVEIATPTGPVEEHLQVAAGGLDVLLGVTGPDQAVGLGPLWSPLARALAETDRTVFADCGRLGPASPAMPVLMQADAVLLLARAELEELAHLRERLRFLTATLPARYAGPARIGVILVVRERDRAAAPRTEQLLRASGLAVPVLGAVADDPRGAGRLRGLHGGRPGRSTLVRSVRSLLPAVTALTGRTPTVGVLTEAARVSAAGSVNGHAAPQPPRPARALAPRPAHDQAPPDDPPVPAVEPVEWLAAEPNDPLEAAEWLAPEPIAGSEPDGTGHEPISLIKPAGAGAGPIAGSQPDGTGSEPISLIKTAGAGAEPIAVTEPAGPENEPTVPSGPVAVAAGPLPEGEPAFEPDPETDVWLGTRAAAGPAPAGPTAAEPPPVPSPYRHAWPPGPEPATDADPVPQSVPEPVSEPVPRSESGPVPQSVPGSDAETGSEIRAAHEPGPATNHEPGHEPGHETENETENETGNVTQHESEQVSEVQPAENGWPRPGRGTPGATATVLQNWGR